MTARTKHIRSIDVLKDAWDRLSGSKASILMMILCITCISFLVNQIFSHLITSSPTPSTLPEQINPWLHLFVHPLLTNACIGPFLAASIMLGVNKNRGHHLRLLTGFSLLSSFIHLMLTALIMSAIVNIVIATIASFVSYAHLSTTALVTLQICTLIYSLIIYSYLILALPAVIDQKLSCMQALYFSLSHMKHYFFKAITLLITIYALIFASLIPAAIGLMLNHQYVVLLGYVTTGLIFIWLIPYAVMIQGTLYHKVVDDSESKQDNLTTL